MKNVIIMFTFVFTFAAPNAYAQHPDAGVASQPDAGAPAAADDPLGACFIGCAQRMSSFEEGSGPQTVTEMTNDCRQHVEACRQIDEPAMQRLGNLCDQINARRQVEPVESAPAPVRSHTQAFCIMTDGTPVDSDSCGCPSGTFPLRVSRERSSDRLRSLGVPRGHVVFVCYNPVARTGTPGSATRASEDTVERLETLETAQRALCAPQDGETMRTACARAREMFHAATTGTGPVDLEPFMRQLENLVETVGQLTTLVNGHTDVISALSGRVDSVIQCVMFGEGHAISYVMNGELAQASCRDLLAAVGRQVLDQARRIAVEAGRQGAREELARHPQHEQSEDDPGRAFVMLQGFGLVMFNPLTRSNVSYGNLSAFGFELTIGIALGVGLNAHGGIGIGYGAPDIQGMTNVEGVWRLGLGGFVVPEVMIGAGVTGMHRFTPDVFSAESIYGAYLEADFRFLPREEWSPVLSIRLDAGASPRQQGRNAWGAEANGALHVLFGAMNF
jgi:hypothetical protein